ncbi:hypothetical protein [Bradyrhizobium sp.]|uniref:hypothetical protein n=1 Tax=Bradyrhizobium sp. TaxID=376 RepID=UPI0025BCE6F0|nr:hypothetical protein [Bradyrhizobium sp.]
MVAAARDLPASGYALEVDGRLKAEFATRDGAKAGGEELKKRFPMLQIRIYDAQTNAREEISLSGSCLCASASRGPGLYERSLVKPPMAGQNHRGVRYWQMRTFHRGHLGRE